MNDAQKQLHDLFEAYRHTSRYKDDAMVEIFTRRAEYEQRLDAMWSNYTRGNLQQVFAYRRQVDDIKAAGLQVLRHKTTAKHKIVLPKR